MSKRNDSLVRELRSIRTQFRRLARSFARIAPVLGNGADRSEKSGSTRRKSPFTAKHRAALKLQGKYMGTMRGLKPRQRARVKKVRAEKGVRAAIAEARRMARQ